MRPLGTASAVAFFLAAASPTCAASFTPGEFVTYDQFEYGTNTRLEEPNDPMVAALLENSFDAAFAEFSGLMEIGVPGPAGHSIIFDSPDAVIAYLPAGGAPGPLIADLLDPTTSSSGFLGGEVAEATLDVDFSKLGVLAHPEGIVFGNLVFQNLEDLVGTPFVGDADANIANLNGQTVHEVLSEANLALGGLASVASAADFADALYVADYAFKDGLLPSATFVNGDVFTPSAYLVAPAVPAVPEPPIWALLIAGVVFTRMLAFRPVAKGEKTRASLARCGAEVGMFRRKVRKIHHVEP